MYALSQADLLTFSNQPRLVRLQPGEQLCRFVTPGGNFLHGRFWIRHRTLTDFVNKARKNKIPVHEFARHMMAIKRSWSPNMLGLIFLRISQPTQAYAGLAKYQTEVWKEPNVIQVFRGGAEQIVFPFYNNATIVSYFRKFSTLGAYISDIDSLV